MSAQHGRSLTGESPEHAQPSSGKCIVRGKGVRREAESEGSPRQTSGLTNRNRIRRNLRIRLHDKLKSNSYNRSRWEWANSRKGYARVASSFIMQRAVTKEILKRKGLVSLLDHYQAVHI